MAVRARSGRYSGKPLLVFGEDSTVQSLSKGKKRLIDFKGNVKVVERISLYKGNPCYSAALSLARIFYPRKFPEILASGIDGRTTYSKRIFLDRTSQQAINDYYHRRPDSQKSKEHKAMVRRLGNQPRIMERESGIYPNYHFANVGFDRRKSPVFFEILRVHLPTLERRVNAMRESIKKRQAIGLLDAIRKFGKEDEDGFVRVHR